MIGVLGAIVFLVVAVGYLFFTRKQLANVIVQKGTDGASSSTASKASSAVETSSVTTDVA